jgi:hypothetical protein
VNDTQKINFLGGQVAALEAFVVASINSHPNVALLHQEFSRIKVAQESSSLPTSVTEEYLEGQSATANDIQRHLDAVLRGNP